MVVLTGQVPTPVIGSDAFQEVDTVGITRPCVKHNFLVKDVRDLALTIRKAFYIATTGRPGPVVVDIPKDVTDPNIKIPYDYPREIKMRSYNPTQRGHQGQIRQAVDLMLAAKRPVIYTGGGVILGEGSAELRELVRETGFPDHQHPDGARCLPGDRSAVPRHARHARYLRIQYGDARDRLPDRHRRPLRRPRDRQDRALLPPRQDRPHRRGSVVHLQDGAGRCTYRRRRCRACSTDMLRMVREHRTPGRSTRAPRAIGGPRSTSGGASTACTTTTTAS